MEFKNILPEPNIERVTIEKLTILNLNIPECQREKEWDDSMYSNAIDSLIQNIDIGQIILSCNNNLYEVIDGQHRYEAIIKFIKEEIFIYDKFNKKINFNEIKELFLNKKITLCIYNNLTTIQKSQLYIKINCGIEQNIEHMEKINGANNITEYMKKYYTGFESTEVADLILNIIMYILTDYYHNGEATIIIKNLTKRNHFLKNLNKLDEDFNTDDTKKILELNDYILQQIFLPKSIFYENIKKLNKIKISIFSAIFYHIFHENYDKIKYKIYKFDKDIFYYKMFKMLETEKRLKIKDYFNIIIKSYDTQD
jgi:hypothetical protein